MNIRYFSAGSSWRSVLGKKCPRGFAGGRRSAVALQSRIEGTLFLALQTDQGRKKSGNPEILYQ